jgi:hypothetical protein
VLVNASCFPHLRVAPRNIAMRPIESGFCQRAHALIMKRAMDNVTPGFGVRGLVGVRPGPWRTLKAATRGRTPQHGCVGLERNDPNKTVFQRVRATALSTSAEQ